MQGKKLTKMNHRKFSLLRLIYLFIITILISIIPNNIQLSDFPVVYTWALLAIPLILIFNLWWRRRELDSFQISKPRLAIEKLAVQISEPNPQHIAQIAKFLRQQADITNKEFVVLIEKVSFNDHQAEFFDRLIDQLREQDIAITRYFFKANPHSGYKTQAQISPELLTDLNNYSPENPLIIISEGNNPITNDLLKWILHSSHWSNCILLTLDDIWNKNSLKIDNFYLSSIDEIPQRATELQIDREWHSEYPRYLYEYPSRWLEANAPEPTVQTELLKQIQTYLGKDNYQCLCAIAAYPELHWALTRHLGNQFNSLNITKLIRLPWFRQAYMPNWLRERLLQDLSIQKIRAALNTIPLAAKNNSSTDKLYIKVMGENWAIKFVKFLSYIATQLYRLLTPLKLSITIITLVFIITNQHLYPHLETIPRVIPEKIATTLPRDNTNFIVLIQDTVEIDQVARYLIAVNLPKLLYTGTNPYRPKLDYLSLIFVDSKFKWQKIKQGQDQLAFSNTLSELMSQQNRAKGTNYSHFLAKMTVLPYVEQQLKNIPTFARTILITLDKQTNNNQEPPNEIAKKVKQFFQIQDKTNIILKSSNSDNNLNYKVAEISPNPKQLEDILDYPKQVKLDRIAISNEKIIQISNKKINLKIAASEYWKPETIEIFFNKEINHIEIPSSITACIKTKICQVQADGTIFIPFIDTNKLLLKDLEIKFKLKFHYNIPDIYTHQWLNIDDNSIKIDSIKPLIIPAHSFFSNIFPERILDDKTLLELYDPLKDASQGLNQETAKNRILKPRTEFNQQIWITASIFAIIQISLFILLFYEFYYRRRYQLKLNWLALNNIEIDLNTATKQLLGTIVVKHDKRKPEIEIEIEINYDNNQFSENGILLTESNSIPIGFKGEELQTKIIETLTNILTLYLFIDTEAINSYTASNKPIRFDKLEIAINIAGKTVLKRKLEFTFHI